MLFITTVSCRILSVVCRTKAYRTEHKHLDISDASFIFEEHTNNNNQQHVRKHMAAQAEKKK